MANKNPPLMQETNQNEINYQKRAHLLNFSPQKYPRHLALHQVKGAYIQNTALEFHAFTT